MDDILIISNYYPPEKGAAANRIQQLAHKLYQNKYNVSVICPLGNYPKGELFPEYKGKFSVVENRENIKVNRLWIYPSVSKNILIRIISVLSFSLSLFFFLLFKKTPHKVIVQSPPLLISFISVLVLSLKKKKIIVNISDLWPLAAIELKAIRVNSLSHKISLFFEKYIYKKATIILGQSYEIINHIKFIYPNKNCFLYRNFPEHTSLDIIFKKQDKEPIKIFYAGLLGIAQGVFELCKNIELKDLTIELHIFGDGAERKELEKFISNKKDEKIYFHGMFDRQKLHKKLSEFDIAIVPLKTRIYGSVPSKIFEYTSLGFPVLYFGGGEGETIVKENNLGWVASVEDYYDLNKRLQEISKLTISELNEKRIEIFEKSKKLFNLDFQIISLIENNVF